MAEPLSFMVKIRPGRSDIDGSVIVFPPDDTSTIIILAVVLTDILLLLRMYLVKQNPDSKK